MEGLTDQAAERAEKCLAPVETPEGGQLLHQEHDRPVGHVRVLHAAKKTPPGTLKISNLTGNPMDTRFEVLGEDGNWHRLGHVQALTFSVDAAKNEGFFDTVTLRILCPLLDLQAAPPHVSWRRVDHPGAGVSSATPEAEAEK